MNERFLLLSSYTLTFNTMVVGGLCTHLCRIDNVVCFIRQIVLKRCHYNVILEISFVRPMTAPVGLLVGPTECRNILFLTASLSRSVKHDCLYLDDTTSTTRMPYLHLSCITHVLLAIRWFVERNN